MFCAFFCSSEVFCFFAFSSDFASFAFSAIATAVLFNLDKSFSNSLIASNAPDCFCFKFIICFLVAFKTSPFLKAFFSASSRNLAASLRASVASFSLRNVMFNFFAKSNAFFSASASVGGPCKISQPLPA